MRRTGEGHRRPFGAIRAIVETPALNDTLFLVKNGVPFDVAFSLDDEERSAWAIIFCQFEGNKFDWTRGRWAEKG